MKGKMKGERKKGKEGRKKGKGGKKRRGKKKFHSRARTRDLPLYSQQLPPEV